MSCPACKHPVLKTVGSWARYTDNTIGYDDSVIDYQQFVSRSTKYRCVKCGYSFIYYSKKYDPQENNLTHKDKKFKIV